LRRTSDYPLDSPVRIIVPPAIIAFECEFFIEAGDRK